MSEQEHERYAGWDGAYVLGALPPGEREEYERHLAGCPRCTHAVAELLPLPGLLARVEEEDRERLLSDEAAAAPVPPADLERRLLAAAHAEADRAEEAERAKGAERADGGAPLQGRPPWWRRTRTRVAVGLAAAAVVAVAVVVPLAGREDPAVPPPTRSVALRQTVPSPLSATVALTRTGWGTRIDMTCFYAGEKGGGPSRDYGLYVIDERGEEHEVSSWWAGPGEEARTTGSTDLAVDDLRTVQVRAADGVTVLLSAAV